MNANIDKLLADVYDLLPHSGMEEPEQAQWRELETLARRGALLTGAIPDAPLDEIVKTLDEQARKLLELGWVLGGNDDGTFVWIAASELDEAMKACKGAGDPP